MANSPASRTSSIFQFALIFLLVYIASQLFMNQFFPAKEVPVAGAAQGIILEAPKAKVGLGGNPIVNIRNQTASGFTLASRCPLPPLDFFRVVPTGTGSESYVPMDPKSPALPCTASSAVAAGETTSVDLRPWKNAFFNEMQVVEARLPAESAAFAAPNSDRVRIEVSEPNVFVKLFRVLIMKPFLNFLILIASITPNHELGIAIIVLTLAVKLLLFYPTQRSMEGQKKMQLLQPKLEELKKKYPGDAKKQQEETLRLWKEHGINPFGSCLPLLIQFPVLIGLFYVIQDATVLELSRHLIYPAYQHLTWSFDTQFLWLDLLKPDWYFFPAALVVMQFVQMKLAFAIQKKKSGPDAAPIAAAQQMQQKLMLYGLPVMIGVFAFQFPAAVSLYWGVSTLFAIGQQMIVNREHLRV